MQKFKLTPEQIAEWKAAYGTFYKLTAETGEVCYIKDPVSSLKIMSAAMKSLNVSSIAFVQTILNNCFIGGDESIKTNE
ncbi:MAG: hypothetical protein EAY68_10045, partial [Bacteroidetes bacterium]